jgi:hypothetical protein
MAAVWRGRRAAMLVVVNAAICSVESTENSFAVRLATCVVVRAAICSVVMAATCVVVSRAKFVRLVEKVTVAMYAV